MTSETPQPPEEPQSPDEPESHLFDCSDPQERVEGLRLAAAALRRQRLVVLPTDTVYGVAADAFSPAAVTALLAAKGRGRQSPPPVLVGGPDLLPALATSVTDAAQALAEAFWPGGLTLICRAQPSLTWDLGDTAGTVALRVPDHALTVELLRRTGPLAVSSANLTGKPPGETARAVRAQLGSSVAVYLEDGPAGGGVSSTIVDTTGLVPVVLRSGDISLSRLREVVPEVEGPPGSPPPDSSGTSAAEPEPSGTSSDERGRPPEGSGQDAG